MRNRGIAIILVLYGMTMGIMFTSTSNNRGEQAGLSIQQGNSVLETGHIEAAATYWNAAAMFSLSSTIATVASSVIVLACLISGAFLVRKRA